MRFPDPYRLADLTISQLNRSAVRLADQTKRKLVLLGFDELNVIHSVDAMYQQIDKNTRRKFKDLFCARYEELMIYMLGRKLTGKETDIIDELAEMYIFGLLDEPNATTKYTYQTELLRKRDRAKEAIIAEPTRIQKQVQLDKHLRYTQQMISWYADFVSQGAEIEAYKDAGVKKVQRHETLDKKTCNTCRKADGKVYPIDKVPDLPHLNCRGYFTPVLK